VQRRAAQLIVIPTLGLSAQDLQPVLQRGVGGVLLLGDSVPTDLAGQVAAADALTADRLPLLVMADEEGGGVQRLRPLVSDMPWARTMARTLSPQQVQQLAQTVGRQMRTDGVGVDLGPVLDVDGGAGPDQRDADGLRSFSADPTVATRYGVAFLRGLSSAEVIAVVKHFPGLGGATGNTDQGPAQTLPLAALRTVGLPPFQAAVDAGAPAVMVSNAVVPGTDALPAALSRAVIGGLLRQQLGFHGLVLTDSLSAGAIIRAGYDVPAAAALAVGAGADLVLFGSTLTPADTAMLDPVRVESRVRSIIGAITARVATGAITMSELDTADRLVLHAKAVTVCG